MGGGPVPGGNCSEAPESRHSEALLLGEQGFGKDVTCFAESETFSTVWLERRKPWWFSRLGDPKPKIYKDLFPDPLLCMPQVVPCVGPGDCWGCGLSLLCFCQLQCLVQCLELRSAAGDAELKPRLGLPLSSSLCLLPQLLICRSLTCHRAVYKKSR